MADQDGADGPRMTAGEEPEVFLYNREDLKEQLYGPHTFQQAQQFWYISQAFANIFGPGPVGAYVVDLDKHPCLGNDDVVLAIVIGWADMTEEEALEAYEWRATTRAMANLTNTIPPMNPFGMVDDGNWRDLHRESQGDPERHSCALGGLLRAKSPFEVDRFEDGECGLCAELFSAASRKPGEPCLLRRRIEGSDVVSVQRIMVALEAAGFDRRDIRGASGTRYPGFSVHRDTEDSVGVHYLSWSDQPDKEREMAQAYLSALTAAGFQAHLTDDDRRVAVSVDPVDGEAPAV